MSKSPLSFEEALRELEALAQTLENNQMSLDAAVEAYETSQRLLQICTEHLNKAEKKIKKLIKKSDPSGDTLFDLEDFV